jgi:peptidoglycan/xylan/chitin deacetylase (PgdA/CDA1 family)
VRVPDIAENLSPTMHALTFDIEDWYQGFISRSINGWQQFGSREIRNVGRVLEILAEFRTRATFFILGKLAVEQPRIVKLIDESGHEVASHGFEHLPLPRHTRSSFSADVGRSIDTL